MRQKLNILIVGDSSSPHIQNRSKCFYDQGHSVCFLTEVKCGLKWGKEIYLGQDAQGSNRLSTKFKLIGRIRKILKDIRPDIVHIHYAFGFYVFLAAILSRCPVVVTVMGSDILLNKPGFGGFKRKMLTKMTLKQADFITGKSNYLITGIKKIINIKHEPTRITWGIKPGMFHPGISVENLKKELALKENDKIVFCPRALKSIHNIDNLVKALSAVLKYNKNVKLLISKFNADENYANHITSLVAKLGLENEVIFVEKIDYDDMRLYYNLADVVISISSSDGLPHFLIESMACGVPNILSNLKSYAEVAEDNKNVIFVNYNDTKNIADGIIRLLSDKNLRDNLVKNTFKLVQEIGDYLYCVIFIKDI